MNKHKKTKPNPPDQTRRRPRSGLSPAGTCVSHSERLRGAAEVTADCKSRGAGREAGVTQMGRGRRPRLSQQGPASLTLPRAALCAVAAMLI